MVNFFEFINENTIKPAPRPLRIDGEDIFTTDEAIYNQYGYYHLEREEYPQDEEYYYTPYYELVGNVIYQKWRRGEQIESEVQPDAE